MPASSLRDALLGVAVSKLIDSGVVLAELYNRKQGPGEDSQHLRKLCPRLLTSFLPIQVRPGRACPVAALFCHEAQIGCHSPSFHLAVLDTVQCHPIWVTLRCHRRPEPSPELDHTLACRCDQILAGHP
jgi:hypothetical protein